MAGPLDLLLQSSAKLFEDACTPELQESVEDGEWPVELWRAIDDNGLPLALVPESQGGIGLRWPEAMAVLRLAGSFAVPAPLAESMLAARLLAEAGFDAPSGAEPGSAAWTVAPFGSDEPLELALSAELGGQATPGGSETESGGYLLTGRVARVPWCEASATSWVALTARDAGDNLLAVRVQAVAEEVRSRRSASGEPVADLVFDRRLVRAEDVGPVPDHVDADILLSRLALARSAQMAGAMERILDLTLEHARERQQFGRPIAHFQAVQQQIAELAAEVAVVSAAVEAAAACFDRDEASRASRLAVAASKARAGEAASKVTAIAHQVHGAIGFTREHVLHRFTRRLWTWRDEAGHDREWQERIGRQVAEAGADGLWELLCAEG